MTLVKNTVVALIIVITTSAGAVAGYFIGMKQENRRLNELLRDTHTQLSGVIQDDATAGSDAIRYRQQGADGDIGVGGGKSLEVLLTMREKELYRRKLWQISKPSTIWIGRNGNNFFLI